MEGTVCLIRRYFATFCIVKCLTICQSDPWSDNSNIDLCMLYILCHTWGTWLTMEPFWSVFNGWGRYQLSNAILLQNSYCMSKVSEGFLQALSRQDISSFGPQALLLLPSALDCLALHTLGTSGSFLLTPAFMIPWYMTQSIALKSGF